ncbi:MAG: adenylate/guanylate cyclase domain-containing protein [Saprospiraceae bacterium]
MKPLFQKYAYPIAGLLALAGIVFWFWSKPAGSNTVESGLFQPEQEKLAAILSEIKVFGFAGEPRNQQDSLAVALDLYGGAKYEKAMPVLEGYLAAYPDDHVARFYFGMTHLYLKKSAEAFAILSPLSELASFDMQDDARWYAALAAANVDRNRAIGLFARLSKEPDSKYREAAAAVMASLLESPDNLSFQVDAAGTALKCSLVVGTTAAWWQSGWLRALFALLFPAGGLGLVVWNRRFRQLTKEKASITQDKERSDALLRNILPAEVTEELKATGHANARLHEQVTVLFSDFKHFTQISEELPPEELVANLNEIFAAYDNIITAHGLEKIKTVGDCYICAGGILPDGAQQVANPDRSQHNAIQIVRAAQAMMAFLKKFNERQTASGKPVFEARTGIHTGTVVAGIVGIKKFAYDIWGDTVNIAARMEQASEAGRINISGSTQALVQEVFPCHFRGKVEAKGKGAVEMYFVGD